MTDNSDFASRGQHPDAASTPPPQEPTPGQAGQQHTSPPPPPQAPEGQQSPYARPQPDAGQPSYAATGTQPAAAQSAVAQSAAAQPAGAQSAGTPDAGTHTGAQPTAAYPASTTQPTAAYPLTGDAQPTTEYPRTDPAADPERKPGSKTVPLVIAALVVGALAGGVSGAGIASLAVNNARTETTAANPTTVTVNQPDDATVVTAAAATAAPSTVTIYVTAEIGAGSGSGVVISDDGYIISNSHVVTLGGAVADPQVQVQTYDGRLLDATVVGRDPIADIAVIKVDDTTGLQPAEFADSDELNVGDTTVALGAPLGLPNSVSSGIVSALNRSITVSSSEVPEEVAPDDGTEESPAPFDFWNFDIPGQEEEQQAVSSRVSLAVIQTDAAINQGNSGGALVNAQGEIIGINVAIASAGGEGSGNIGLGFAIPSNLALRVAQELIDDGQASHGLLGASVSDATGDTAVDADVVGAVIQEVTDGGAAAQAGLRAGDVVTGVNGIPITSSTDLTAQIRALAGGSEAEIAYVRGGDGSTVQVTLGELE
jgi:putative serine protease PepD